MDLFQLTRALIAIDSVTGSERRIGDFLFDHLAGLEDGGTVERMPVVAERFNVFAAWGEPVPKTIRAARKIASKGRRLLDRYQRSKDSQK